MTREERKIRAYYRAQLSLKHSFERIDHDFDVIKPKIEEHKAQAKLQKAGIVTAELEAPDA